MQGRVYNMAGDDVTDTLGDTPRPPHSPGLGTLGGPGSIGASVWELLHPDQVQAEARAIGAPVPSIMDVVTGAVNDIGTTAQDNVTAGIDAATKTGQWIVVGLVAFAVIELLNKTGRK